MANKKNSTNKTRKRPADRRTLSAHRKRSASTTHPPKQPTPLALAASGFQPNPHRLYRTGRLAEIFDTDRSTIWRWRKSGVLPEFKKIGGVEGLTEAQLADVFAQRSAANV